VPTLMRIVTGDGCSLHGVGTFPKRVVWLALAA